MNGKTLKGMCEFVQQVSNVQNSEPEVNLSIRFLEKTKKFFFVT